jgi:hypothetical protein
MLMFDLDKYTLEQMAELARGCFHQGFEDAMAGRRIMTAGGLWSFFFSGKTIEYRTMHQIKMRQVYGAGYDLGRMHKEIKAWVLV